MVFFVSFIFLLVGTPAFGESNNVRSSDLIMPPFTVKAHVKWAYVMPYSVPDNTFLHASLQDSSLQDVPSRLLVSVMYPVTNATLQNPITLFLVPSEPLERSDMKYSVQAVLNIGWKQDSSSNEWIRKGDYLTDTHHALRLQNVVGKSTDIDIDLVPYPNDMIQKDINRVQS